jgi:Glycosyl transferase family 11
MIHVRLAGGLGNQLFQLTAAALADKDGKHQILVYVGALNDYDFSRQPDALRLLGENVSVSAPTGMLQRIRAWLIEVGRIGLWLPRFGLNNARFEREAPHGLSRHGTLVLDGYFQRGWTHEAMCQALGRLKPRPPAAGGRIAPDECAVHIRGGDFLRIPIYNVATVDYYVKAITQAKQAGYTRFAIITDDDDHAHRTHDAIVRRIAGITMRVAPSSAEVLEDFDSLRSASARIISNSTFAWWAAALDEKQSLTWSPSQFTLGVERDYALAWEIQIPAVEVKPPAGSGVF